MATLWAEVAGVPLTQRYYNAGGVQTRVLELGDAEEAIIFLHGSGGHAEAYVRNLRAHAEHYRVLSVDMLGHGFTDKPDKPYEIVEYVNHLNDLLDAAGIDAAHLSGESLGGWVAARFAAVHPDRTRSLLLNTAGGVVSYPEVMERVRTLSLAAVREASPEAVRKRLEFLMADPTRVTDDLVETRFAIYTQPGFLRAMENILCVQYPGVRDRNLLTAEELSRITAPTLVLWTTHDPTGPVEVGRKLADSIPGARFVVMDDCGHWPQFEDAETFNRLSLEHLQRASRGA